MNRWVVSLVFGIFSLVVFSGLVGPFLFLASAEEKKFSFEFSNCELYLLPETTAEDIAFLTESTHEALFSSIDPDDEIKVRVIKQIIETTILLRPDLLQNLDILVSKTINYRHLNPNNRFFLRGLKEAIGKAKQRLIEYLKVKLVCSDESSAVFAVRLLFSSIFWMPEHGFAAIHVLKGVLASHSSLVVRAEIANCFHETLDRLEIQREQASDILEKLELNTLVDLMEAERTNVLRVWIEIREQSIGKLIQYLEKRKKTRLKDELIAKLTWVLDGTWVFSSVHAYFFLESQKTYFFPDEEPELQTYIDGPDSESEELNLLARKILHLDLLFYQYSLEGAYYWDQDDSFELRRGVLKQFDLAQNPSLEESEELFLHIIDNDPVALRNALEELLNLGFEPARVRSSKGKTLLEVAHKLKRHRLIPILQEYM